MSSSQLSLFGGGDERSVEPEAAAPQQPDADADARSFAVDPRHNVVLEASAGTGKTTVLVSRYINLLKAGVDPANVLAITFTRKAAAEMRERIIADLREAAALSAFDRARWLELRDRLGDIAISTIDAFCLSLLREFPLEADLDPGFNMADETEVPRLVEESLDRSMRIVTGLARREPDVALVLAQLGVTRTREGLATLLERRLVATSALDRFLADGPANLTAEGVCRRAAVAMQDVVRTVPGGIAQFLADGPIGHPRFALFARELDSLGRLNEAPDGAIRALLDRVGSHFLTGDGRPRTGGPIHPYKADHYPSPEAARRHRNAVFQLAPAIQRVVSAFARDLNVVLARGVRRMFAVALTQYRQLLEARSVLDFPDVLERALDLLRRMDEFSQSRFRLESRYHHVLVDEFQDTSRAQWELVALLIQSWGEGLGLATEPSIFIVGDRKQSIYRFRDAEVAVLQEAARHIQGLRPAGDPRRSITRSFRAVPLLQEFVNEIFGEMARPPVQPDDFTYGETDRFPIATGADRPARPVLGISAAGDAVACARAVALEIERILAEEDVRDRKTGVSRRARPGDIAILFRSRTSHREFESELEARGIRAYVYKGLGFFDADEIKDLSALVRYLADPGSDLRAAAFLRSRFVRLSDRALAAFAPGIAGVLAGPGEPQAAALEQEDRSVLSHVREHVPRWLERADRVPPADLIDEIVAESAYAYELSGPRCQQAWENVKKMRGLIRRIQNRGYATLPRIADHLDALSAGDESNAVLEALDAVNLMTVHAAKGLEFPVVFVVNLSKGASGPPPAVRVSAGEQGAAVSVGSFVSEMDEAEREREKHETRRLLYVALTRARDRLYLSTVLKDGSCVPGRGSLAEVLPESLRELFGRAATAFDACDYVAWTARSGRSFEWRICRGDVPPVEPGQPLQAGSSPAIADLVAPIEHASTVSRHGVTDWLGFRGAGRSDVPVQDRTVGTLVHRLFQFWGDRGAPADCGTPDPVALAATLLTAEERTSLENPGEIAGRAVDAWEKIRTRGEVVELLAAGTVLHEVPFSMTLQSEDGPIVLRGAIDCLVARTDGSVAVVEFKTGRPHPVHEEQLAVYVRAAQSLFPGVPVEGHLVYP